MVFTGLIFANKAMNTSSMNKAVTCLFLVVGGIQLMKTRPKHKKKQ